MQRRGVTPNDNGSVIQMLSKKMGAYNRSRNRLLLGAVVLSIVSLTVVFGLAYGRAQAEYQRSIREAGTTASACIQNGDQSQYEKARALSYIRQAGRRVTAGTAEKTAEDAKAVSVCTVQWLDPGAWEKIVSPAYTDIYGEYPEKPQEILLSKRALQKLGIKDPQMGMEITVDVSIGLFQKGKETFTLCGWFTDHVKETQRSAPGYISFAKLEGWGYHVHEDADILLCPSERLNWREVEERLYEDIPIRDGQQQLTVSESAAYEAVREMAGGFEMAAGAALIILCGIFFLIHNVMQISLISDVRQMGLLNLIGTTEKQIRRIYYRQILRILVPGVLLGAGISLVLLLFLLPHGLGEQYLSSYGGAVHLRVFRPWILAAAILLSAALLLGSAAEVIWHVASRSCVENTRYTALNTKKARRKKKDKKRNHYAKKRGERAEIFLMAWQNVTRYKSRFIRTVLSLFLGMEALLGAVVISSGSDPANAIKERPDFLIAGQFSQWAQEEGYGREYQSRDGGEDPLESKGSGMALLYDNEYDEFSPISPEVRKRLLSLDGVDQETSSLVEGAYLYSVISRKGWRPLANDRNEEASENEMIEGPDPDVVQILSEEEIEELKTYAKKHQIPADMKSLEEGTGVLILHDHRLSRQQEAAARESIGEPMYFATLPAKADLIKWNQMGEKEREEWAKGDGFARKRSEPFAISGYLDSLAEGFPDIARTWHGAEGTIYYLISQQGFARIPTDKKTLTMELELKKEDGAGGKPQEDQTRQETQTKTQIGQIIEVENQRRAQIRDTGLEKGTGEAGIFCISKSDLLEEAAAYIRGSRLIFGSISAVLLCAGLVNFFHVMAAGILSRKKELEILESIGMTKRQKRLMFLAEGGWYCVVTAALHLSIGSWILALIRHYMEQRLSYFVFHYPVGWTALLLTGLTAICLSAAAVFSKK